MEPTPATIVRIPITSSNLKAIGYDEEHKILEVEFKGGGVYRYKDVPKETFESFLSSPSLGKFFMGSIRNRFLFERLI